MRIAVAIQRPRLTALVLSVVFLFSCIGTFSVDAFCHSPRNDTTEPVIRNSGFLVAIMWCFLWPGLVLPLRAGVADQERIAVRFLQKVFYLLGALLCLFHLAVAFHVGHAWSHRKAVEHTERTSGYGWGIWVNYAFALVWVAEVAWMWVAFDHYLKRPRWLRWAVVGFMGFIVFNAAFVFSSGANRWLWLAFASVPVVLVIAPRRWWRKRKPFSGGPNGSAANC